MVFFSSCNSVKFHSELLNYIDLPVLDIHGKQKQQKRTSTYFEFCNADKGILLCTDVAARGLDIPAVDWIIQVGLHVKESSSLVCKILIFEALDDEKGQYTHLLQSL
jgi:superfamily II DNA/RNA helicase